MRAVAVFRTLAALAALAVSAAASICDSDADFTASAAVSGSTCQAVADDLLSKLPAVTWGNVTCDSVLTTVAYTETGGAGISVARYLGEAVGAACCGSLAATRCFDETNMCRVSSDFDGAVDLSAAFGSPGITCASTDVYLLTARMSTTSWSSVTCDSVPSDAAQILLTVGAACCGALAKTRDPQENQVMMDRGSASTVAGSTNTHGLQDGYGTVALFTYPFGIAATPDGKTIFIADSGEAQGYTGANDMIRAIDYETGAVTSIADISNPNGIVLAPDGNLFMLHPDIKKIRTLNVTTGVSTISSDDCSTCGEGIAINADGTTIVSGGYHRVHLIDVATGAVSILAGKSSPGMNNGIGTNSEFVFPVGVAVAPTGDVVVADMGNNMIRKISVHDANVTTLAGDTGVAGFSDGTLSTATFHSPVGILATPDGKSIYVTERGNSAVRWIDLVAGTVSTLAGSGSPGSAAFSFYHAYMALGSSSLIIADASAHVIRDIAFGGCQCGTGFSGPDGGPCLACSPGRFKSSNGSSPCVVCPTGTYQIESHASACKACDVGSFQNSSAASSCNICPAGFFSSQEGQTSCVSCPAGATSPAGSVAHAQCACGDGAALIAAGVVSTVAGAGSSLSGSTDGVGSLARFSYPRGIDLADGTLVIGDATNNEIRLLDVESRKSNTLSTSITGIANSVIKIAPDGNLIAGGLGNLYSVNLTTGDVETLVSGLPNCQGMTFTSDGATGVLGCEHLVGLIDMQTSTFSVLAGSSSAGFADDVGTAALFKFPLSVAVTSGMVYSVDLQHKIRRIDISTGTVTTFVGGAAGWVDGVGTDALLNSPTALVLTPDENTLVVSERSDKIRLIDIASRRVSTLAGGSVGFVDGMGSNAHFSMYHGYMVATSDGSSVFVADASNNAIRQVTIKRTCSCSLGYTGQGALADCTACSPGSYKDIVGSSSCVSCSANTFSESVAATTPATCAPCQMGSSSPTGSTSQSACVCDTPVTCPDSLHLPPHQCGLSSCTCSFGFTGAAGGTSYCVECGSGKFKNSWGFGSCLDCPAGTFTPGNSTGYAECLKCRSGTFKENAGTGVCTLCPKGSISSPGSTTDFACRCIASHKSSQQHGKRSPLFECENEEKGHSV